MFATSAERKNQVNNHKQTTLGNCLEANGALLKARVSYEKYWKDRPDRVTDPAKDPLFSEVNERLRTIQKQITKLMEDIS